VNNITFRPVANSLSLQNSKAPINSPFESQKSFASFLNESLDKVNGLQTESDILTEKMALGQNVDLHQVMIASQKASVSMQLTLEVRNKAVEAYQEMMRMQV
jgi:flagellar hook-basal body complex protein FliE